MLLKPIQLVLVLGRMKLNLHSKLIWRITLVLIHVLHVMHQIIVVIHYQVINVINQLDLKQE